MVGARLGWHGSGTACCCDQCQHYELKCHDCCLCVCRSICVTLGDQPGGSASQCRCDDVVQKTDWDCDSDTYHNVIKCGDISVDYEISFRKLSDGNCYVCLDSSCFRSESAESISSQQQCILIGDPSDVRCVDDLGDSTGWVFDLAECVTDTDCVGMSVRLSFECDDLINPVVYLSDDGCESCETCRCTCQCICMNYQLNGEVEGNDCDGIQRVCFNEDNKSWSEIVECVLDDGQPGDPGNFNVEFTLTIEEDSAGECVFVLATNIGDLRPTADLAAQLLNPDITTNCPDFIVSWLITHDDGSESRFDFSCLSCAGGCQFKFEPCCPDVAIPRELTATVKSDDDDSTLGSGILTFNESSFAWEGRIPIECIDDESVICASGFLDLSLICDTAGSQWELTVKCPPTVEETQGEELTPPPTCDPFFIKFQPFGSCKPGALGCCPDWWVEVTE